MGQTLLLALTATLLILACVGITRNVVTGQWHAQPVLVLGTLAVMGSVVASLVGLAKGNARAFMRDGATQTVQFFGKNFALIAIGVVVAVLALEYALPFALPDQASLHCMYPRWRTLTSTWPASLSQWADDATLAKPLKQFHVFSSHNSFLACAQNFTPASIAALQLNLRLGCRCLELDVWNDGGSSVFVSHGTMNASGRFFGSTTSLPLDACLKAVAECAWQATDDPLILYVQNYKMSAGGGVLGDNLKQQLGNRIAQLPQGVKLPDVPIGSLRGKVVLLANGSTGVAATDALIHATFGDGMQNYGYESAFQQKDVVRQQAGTSLVRVYPDARLKTLLSGNQDMVKAMGELRAQMCAINMQGTDAHTEKYLQFFGQRAFVPMA